MEMQITKSARLVNGNDEIKKRIKRIFANKKYMNMKKNGKVVYTPEFVESLRDGKASE